MLAKGDDDRFFVRGQDGGTGRLRAHRRVGCGGSAFPLRDRLRIDPVTARQRSYACLTMLYRSTDRLCRAGAPVKYLAHNSSRSQIAESVPLYSGTIQLAFVLMDCRPSRRGVGRNLRKRSRKPARRGQSLEHRPQNRLADRRAARVMRAAKPSARAVRTNCRSHANKLGGNSCDTSLHLDNAPDLCVVSCERR